MSKKYKEPMGNRICENMADVLSDLLLFLVFINPISKLPVISILEEELEQKDIKKIIFESNVFALIILVAFAFGGTFILSNLFHVETYSLKIAGGIVLFSVGFEVLKKGIFFDVEKHEKKKLCGLAIVPIASPMIAGPATITATIYLAAINGPLYVASLLLIVILINFTIMYFSALLFEKLGKYDFVEALIRITGLFIATIGVELVLGGLGEFLGI